MITLETERPTLLERAICFTTKKVTCVLCLLPLCITIGTSHAHAQQATATWVSGVGDDVNPCSRTAPCKTYAGAISKTAAGGVIRVLDPGGYGSVTITKSITIDGGSGVTSTLASGTNGININAGPSDSIFLRNISIDGAGTGRKGVNFTAGGTLVLENVDITQFTEEGVNVNQTSSATLVLNNVRIHKAATGIKLAASAGQIRANLDDLTLSSVANGIAVNSGAKAVIRNSNISNSSLVGVLVDGGTASILDSVIAFNEIGLQSQADSTLRISNSQLVDNGTAISCAGGVIASTKNSLRVGDTGQSSCSATALLAEE